MKLQQRIDFVRENPIFWSRVGQGPHPSIVNDGKIVLYANWKDSLLYHKHMSEIGGVKIHSSILPLGWIGVDEYDFSIIDEVLDELFKAVPDGYYIPRIKLDAPISWCKKYPEDVFVYRNGPQDKEEIRAMVDTPLQDMLGFNSEGGEAFINGKFEHRRNFDGKIALQSFCSPRWRKDAGHALKLLVEHIENGKYGERILGYHLAYGCCGETTLWGTWERDLNRRGDYGIVAKQMFFDYASSKGMNIDKIPTPEDMYTIKHRHLQDLFYISTANPECKMYADFISQSNVDSLEYFSKIVKDINKEKLVGCFYGYIIEVTNGDHAGHLAIDRVLSSPYIDFVSSPKGYYRVDPCGPGLGQAPAFSINRKKLWVDEIDNRTHLYHGVPDPSKAENFDQTRAVYWREFSKNIAYNQSYWWMDLGGGWLEDEQILKEIKLLNDTGKDILKNEHKPISEVLLLLDDEVMLNMRPVGPLFSTFNSKFGSIVKECGAPIDFYRLKDLYEIDLSKYKVVIFMNSFMLDIDKINSYIAKMRKDVHIIWPYVSGIINNGKYDIDNVRRLTGFSVSEIEPEKEEFRYSDCSFPLVEVNKTDGIEVKKTYPNGSIMFAKRKLDNGKTYYLSAMPTDITAQDIRQVFVDSGVHLYSPIFTTVHADNRFIYVLAEQDYNFTITLPEKKNFVNVFTNQKYYNTDSLDVSLKAGNCIFLKYLS